jgi:hypothetical protein
MMVRTEGDHTIGPKPLPRKPDPRTPHIKRRKNAYTGVCYWIAVKPTTWKTGTRILVQTANKFVQHLNRELYGDE